MPTGKLFEFTNKQRPVLFRCRFSQILKPIFEEASEQFKDNPGKVLFGSVDCDRQRMLLVLCCLILAEFSHHCSKVQGFKVPYIEAVQVFLFFNNRNATVVLDSANWSKKNIGLFEIPQVNRLLVVSDLSKH